MSSSVRLLSVCRLSSVTFVHPTQAIEIFGNGFYAMWYISNPLKSIDNFTESVPASRGLNARGLAKYSDFGPLKSYHLGNGAR